MRIQRDTITVLNLSAVSFLVLLGLSIVAPILPEYAETFNVSYTLVGLIVSAFGIGRIFLDLPAGSLARKYNKKVIMIFGLSLVIISSIMAGLAPNYSILLLARFIEGIGSALYVTTATIFIALVASPERRGRLMSIFTGSFLLGSIFGPSFGGFIATLYGIRAPFFVYAIVVTIGLIPTFMLPRASNPFSEGGFTLREIPRKAWKSLKDRNFLLIFPAIFSLFFIRTGVRSTLVPLYGGNVLGLNESDIGILITLAGIATMATILPIGNISDRIGRRRPLISCLILAAPVTVLIPFTKNMLSLSICLLAYGAIIGLSGPIAAYVTDISPPDQIELYMGVYRTIGDIGFVIGPLLLGFIADLTSTPAVVGGKIVNLVGWPPFVVAACIMIISGLFLLKAPDPALNKKLKSFEP